MKKSIKPPLGLMPKNIARAERFREVREAINRYFKDGTKKIPIEWIEEYNEFMDIYYGDLY